MGGPKTKLKDTGPKTYSYTLNIFLLNKKQKSELFEELNTQI